MGACPPARQSCEKRKRTESLRNFRPAGWADVETMRAGASRRDDPPRFLSPPDPSDAVHLPPPPGKNDGPSSNSGAPMSDAALAVDHLTANRSIRGTRRDDCARAHSPWRRSASFQRVGLQSRPVRHAAAGRSRRVGVSLARNLRRDQTPVKEVRRKKYGSP
jgi:hypothetical protein